MDLETKQKAYKKLVDKRKAYNFPEGLLNPSEISDGIYDKENYIGPWSKWQGNLNAEIMLIGQDWGNLDLYLRCKGSHIDDTPTNSVLKELFGVIGIDIGYPNSPNLNAPVFFTNAVLGIKKGGMSESIKNSWLKNDAEEFLKPTIDIIQPKILITLGNKSYDAVRYIYGIKKENLVNLITKNPINLGDDKLLFAMYHCGQYGIRRSRNFELQKEDWSKIRDYL